MVRVKVLLFGALKEAVGRGEDDRQWDEPRTPQSILEEYCQRFETLRNSRPSILIARNREFTTGNELVTDGDEIAFLPPVSGGSSRASLVREKIETHQVFALIKRPEDGAAVVFEGVVRNNTRGRSTLYLEYEAYEAMALQEMERLCERALQQFGVREVRIVHRLGHIAVGETSVLIIVASAHRGAAFDACRWLIDTLKRTVPIWKKEFLEDGAVWADGEPFPAEIARIEGSHTEKPASK